MCVKQHLDSGRHDWNYEGRNRFSSTVCLDELMLQKMEMCTFTMSFLTQDCPFVPKVDSCANL